MASGNKKRKKSRRPRGYPENSLYRLFVAVDLPAATVESLGDWQQEYLSRDSSLRLTPAAQLHITLAFIGQAGDHERELAFSQMDELTARTAFTASIAALVGLPRGRNPRVVAARVEEDSGTLAALHDELVAGLVKRGIYKREKRPYFPHVTVARSRGRTAIDLSAIVPEPIKFTAVRVTLYNSVLKPSGALHKALKSVQLT